MRQLQKSARHALRIRDVIEVDVDGCCARSALMRYVVGVKIDAAFDRLARRLTSLQLRRAEPSDDIFANKASGAFVGTYTETGLRTVLLHYGLDDKLRARGLGDYRLVVTQEDAFHHRLQILLPSDVHVMDLRLHLARLMLKGDDTAADVVAVEWLLMQNPRAAFFRERPQLPGQTHPGTGLGHDVSQLLQLMTRRIGREGLVVVPERFHLAELYAKRGWLAPHPDADALIDGVVRAAPKLSVAARAWAIERNCVRDVDGAVLRYQPHERILPVSHRLQHALAPGGFWRRALQRKLQLNPRVDLVALRTSLLEQPVPGMDANAF